MIVPGAVLFLTGIGYYFCTQDAPDGNYKELRARDELPPGGRQLKKIILVGSKRLSCMGFVCHIRGLFWR